PSSQREMEQQARDPKTRVFVVYLDMLHTTFAGTQNARRPIVDFLTRTIGKTDLFGYMTAEIPVSQVVFGRRTETIESELERFWAWGQADLKQVARTPAEDTIVNCALTLERPDERWEGPLLQLWREDMLMTSLENLMGRLGDLRDERKSILFISEGWLPRGPREDLIKRLADRAVSRGTIPRVGVGPGGKLGIDATMDPFSLDLRDCAARIDRLINIDFEYRFRQLVTRANRANVSFYPVNVGGLGASSMASTGALKTLAESTDGLGVIGTNDLDSGVRRVSDHQSAFYLLGYYSTNPAADGRFRTIEVKVNQPGVRMSARRGYMAPTAAVMALRPSGPAPGPS
ncbi:MAG: VWA domain-containing protein, partial [Hyphomicrobiales bacterium]|nr:VWA domain-containing protein [Hyphomicrobiales bacterium]